MSYAATVSLAIRVILAVVTGVLAGGVQAAETARTPIQLAVWNPIQIFDSERSVGGFRYSLLWGVNRDVTGLDLSTFASKATGDVQGVQSALFANLVIGSLKGFQFSPLLNQVNGEFFGLQLGGLNFVDGGISGIQLGVFGANTRGGHMRGIQMGMMSSFAEEVTGFQGSLGANTMTRGRGLQISGLSNAAESMTGVQITSIINVAKGGKGVQIAALVNVADDMKGLQLGLLNFNKNGFLPVFPLFNFGF